MPARLVKLPVNRGNRFPIFGNIRSPPWRDGRVHAHLATAHIGWPRSSRCPLRWGGLPSPRKC